MYKLKENVPWATLAGTCFSVLWAQTGLAKITYEVLISTLISDGFLMLS